MRAKKGPNGRKCGFQELKLILHSFYIQLLLINLFLILIEMFDQNPPIRPDWLELGLIRVEKCPKSEKTWLHKLGILVQYFYMHLLLINFISNLNYKVDKSQIFSLDWSN